MLLHRRFLGYHSIHRVLGRCMALCALFMCTLLFSACNYRLNNLTIDKSHLLQGQTVAPVYVSIAPDVRARVNVLALKRAFLLKNMQLLEDESASSLNMPGIAIDGYTTQTIIPSGVVREIQLTRTLVYRTRRAQNTDWSDTKHIVERSSYQNRLDSVNIDNQQQIFEQFIHQKVVDSLMIQIQALLDRPTQ